jgi:hypothetical protein
LAQSPIDAWGLGADALRRMRTPAFVYFERAKKSDGVWRIAVMRGDDLIGHIGRVGERYAYYPGRDNTVDAILHEMDLDRLEVVIERLFR